MKVKVEQSMAGQTKEGVAYSHHPGDEIEVDSDEGKRLVEAGIASPIAVKKVDRAEKRG